MSTASTAAPVPGRALHSLTTTLDATTHAEDIARLRVLDEGWLFVLWGGSRSEAYSGMMDGVFDVIAHGVLVV
jgi:hypothetical protein